MESLPLPPKMVECLSMVLPTVIVSAPSPPETEIPITFSAVTEVVLPLRVVERLEPETENVIVSLPEVPTTFKMPKFSQRVPQRLNPPPSWAIEYWLKTQKVV